ncbi:MAG TPA: hypothetical protein VKW76_00485 [Candidatus Binatia bacterium]|nr:hypothetical protein [Candidatus Binatia bacterium]
MQAVLEDAVRCLAGRGRPFPRLLAAEARAWVADRDASWPFSFDNVCHGLGLEPEAARGALAAVAEAAPAGRETPARRRRRWPDAAAIAPLIRAGEPLRAIAERFRTSASGVSRVSGGLVTRLKADRDERIRALRRAGWRVAALAARFALSRKRIREICTGDGERPATSTGVTRCVADRACVHAGCPKVPASKL